MNKVLFNAISLTVLIIGSAVQAANFTYEFQALKQEELQSVLSGKIFLVKVDKSPVWRWQFNSDGSFTIDIGNYNDSGKWNIKESSVCQESKRGNSGCNEIRVKENILYLKRDNDEIVILQPQ